ncbi:lipopolysaccharide biosynthesis protein [Pedobacter sp. P351]|uniref:lipopolysaccharide biosynthesis protein n=1 Tax=Pedobacter superstes TaxID=3133441 RepID=UPI0030B7C35A
MGPENIIKVSQDDEISMKEIILRIQYLYKYLLKRWPIFVLAIILGGLLGVMYGYTKKPAYKAEIMFVLEESQSGNGLGGYTSLAGQFGIDLAGASGGGVFASSNLLALMKSRSMIQKALLTPVVIDSTKITLAELYIRINNLRDQWVDSKLLASVSFPLGLKPEEFSLAQNAAMKLFHGAITTKDLKIEKPDKETGIISVKVISTHEIFSQQFAEALIKEVSNFYIETKTRKSAANVAILQHQTDSVKRALNSSITGVAVSSDANPNPNLALQVLRTPSQRKQFDVQINQAILTQLIQNLEVAKVSLRKEMPLIQIIDRPIMPLEVVEFSLYKGFFLGAFLAFFLTSFYILFREILRSIMASK